ncbi:M48 family metallopeptidase [Pseudoalteromonas fenneropenaei]|uniref:M48 family metallopeptidase n=1 Tax=Pseudoalteromonas fenneropenaei TaxID=1737459 RepID=A0ABV7CPH4_9GAMM
MNKWLLSALCVALLAGCKTSPTGRNQIALFSSNQMAEMGQASFQEMKASMPIEHEPYVNRYVNCVTNNIIKQLPANFANQAWEVVIFKDESANAFALPGGKIGVHTGLLTVAKDQSQLAAVLGHEVAHVIAEHANERMSQNALLQTGMQVGGAALQMGNVQYRGEIMQALGLGAQFGVILPFSRSHESEADLVGLEYMAKAGFDPKGAIALWQNMQAQSGERQPEFMSTHPAPENRIAKLTAYLPKVTPSFEAAKQQGKAPQCK